MPHAFGTDWRPLTAALVFGTEPRHLTGEILMRAIRGIDRRPRPAATLAVSEVAFSTFVPRQDVLHVTARSNCAVVASEPLDPLWE
jgi:hypothetical protein